MSARICSASSRLMTAHSASWPGDSSGVRLRVCITAILPPAAAVSVLRHRGEQARPPSPVPFRVRSHPEPGRRSTLTRTGRSRTHPLWRAVQIAAVPLRGNEGQAPFRGLDIRTHRAWRGGISTHPFGAQPSEGHRYARRIAARWLIPRWCARYCLSGPGCRAAIRPRTGRKGHPRGTRQDDGFAVRPSASAACLPRAARGK